MERLSEPSRAAVYLRVSTSGQAEHGTSLNTQEKTARAFCERRGWAVVEVVRDAGVSGRRADRPGVKRLRQLAERGEIDVVVPAEGDRFGRSLLDALTLQRDLLEAGCAVVSVDGKIDTTDERNAVTAAVFGAIAEEESKAIGRRTSRGRLAATAEGRFTGSTAPWGWRSVPRTDGPGKMLVPDEDAAEQIRTIVALLRQGTSYADAARHLTERGYLKPGNGRSTPSPWRSDQLRRWVRTRGSRTADARWSLGGIDVEIPPILSPDDAATLREHAELTPAMRQHKSGPYLLSGRLYSACGRKMYGRTVRHSSGRQQTPTYVCPGRYPRGSSSAARCECRAVPVDTTDAEVWATVSEILQRPESLRAMAARTGALPPSTADHEAEIARLRSEMTRTHSAAITSGIDPVVAVELLAPLQAELTRVQGEAERAAKAQVAAAGRRDRHIARAVESLSRGVDTADLPTRIALLDALDVRVEARSRVCPVCEGTGYAPLAGQQGRGFPASCPRCRRMKTVADLDVALDPVASLQLLP